MSELQINTTQNVKINFVSSGVGERVLAFLLDSVIKFGYILLLNKFAGAFQNMDEWSQIGVNTLLSFPVIFYTLVLESILDGQTIGKKALSIRVVKLDGFQATFSDYVVRWFFRIIDIYLFGLGFFVILFSKKNQRIGDMAAGTALVLLKSNIDISHTILEDLNDNYKPYYPSVIKLSDNDARIIKDTFIIAKRNKDYRTMIKLREKIIEVAQIKNIRHSRDVDFISTILKDYNYYTQDM